MFVCVCVYTYIYISPVAIYRSVHKNIGYKKNL